MLRAAIIGAGIGAEHAAAYAQLPGEFQVATVCDLDAIKGQALADSCGAVYTPDIDTVLADPGVDIVDICLPPHLHVQMTLRALDSQKHVICEKPLATSLNDADRVMDRARVVGRQVFPVFQYRFGTGMTQLQALMAAGLAGRCYSGALETHWRRETDYYAVPWRGTWAGEQGGALLCHAIHIHDMVSSVLGPVRSVYAQVATRVNRIETEDCAALVLQMEDGALVTSSVTLGAGHDASRLKLMFEGFTVTSDTAPYAPAAAPWVFESRGAQQEDIDAILAEVAATAHGFVGFLGSVSRSLSANDAPVVTLVDGRRSVELVTAAYASARSGHSEQLPLGEAHPLYFGWLP